MPDRDQEGAPKAAPVLLRRWWPILGVVVVLAVTLFGIDGENASTPEPSPSPALTPPTDGPRVVVPVSGKQAVGGTVTFHGLGGQTLIVLDLDGDLAPGAARLRDGVCGAGSGQDEWLLAGVNDDGTSSTVVDVPLGTLLAGDYVVDLPRAHLPPVAEVCAAIAGEPVNALGTPVDLTGADIGGTRGTGGDGTGGSSLGTGMATPDATPVAGATPLASLAASPVAGSTPDAANHAPVGGTPTR